MPLPSVVVWFGLSPATRVLRQNRSWPSVPFTSMSVVQQLTVNRVPVRAFSGRPPSLGGLNRGSRQVPVQAAVGSIVSLAWVSL